MKFWVAGTALVLAAAAARCETVRLGRLPPPVFADTEVSTNCPLPSWTARTGRFEAAFSFDASPSNNVEIAFGRDSDSDGSLATGEAELVVGWDCGRWFARSLSPEWLEHAEDAAPGRKSFRLSAGLDRAGGIRAVSLSDGGSPVLAGLPAPLRGRLFSKGWDLVRFTARGVERPGDGPRVSLSERGIAFLLR